MIVDLWKRFWRRFGFYKVPMIVGRIWSVRVYCDSELTPEEMQHEIDAVLSADAVKEGK